MSPGSEHERNLLTYVEANDEYSKIPQNIISENRPWLRDHNNDY